MSSEPSKHPYEDKDSQERMKIIGEHQGSQGQEEEEEEEENVQRIDPPTQGKSVFRLGEGAPISHEMKYRSTGLSKAKSASQGRSPILKKKLGSKKESRPSTPGIKRSRSEQQTPQKHIPTSTSPFSLPSQYQQYQQQQQQQYRQPPGNTMHYMGYTNGQPAFALCGNYTPQQQYQLNFVKNCGMKCFGSQNVQTNSGNAAGQSQNMGQFYLLPQYQQLNPVYMTAQQQQQQPQDNVGGQQNMGFFVLLPQDQQQNSVYMTVQQQPQYNAGGQQDMEQSSSFPSQYQ